MNALRKVLIGWAIGDIVMHLIPVTSLAGGVAAIVFAILLCIVIVHPEVK